MLSCCTSLTGVHSHLVIDSICPIIRSLVPVSIRWRGLAGHPGSGKPGLYNCFQLTEAVEQVWKAYKHLFLQMIRIQKNAPWYKMLQNLLHSCVSVCYLAVTGCDWPRVLYTALISTPQSRQNLIMHNDTFSIRVFPWKSILYLSHTFCWTGCAFSFQLEML